MERRVNLQGCRFSIALWCSRHPALDSAPLLTSLPVQPAGCLQDVRKASAAGCERGEESFPDCLVTQRRQSPCCAGAWRRPVLLAHDSRAATRSCSCVQQLLPILAQPLLSSTALKHACRLAPPFAPSAEPAGWRHPRQPGGCTQPGAAGSHQQLAGRWVLIKGACVAVCMLDCTAAVDRMCGLPGPGAPGPHQQLAGRWACPGAEQWHGAVACGAVGASEPVEPQTACASYLRWAARMRPARRDQPQPARSRPCRN